MGESLFLRYPAKGPPVGRLAGLFCFCAIIVFAHLPLTLPYYTYILTSVTYGSYYYGHTKDLEARLKSHNYGKVKSTRARRPWKIHYYEIFSTKKEAAKREYFFKTIEGYKWLKEQGIT